jgi:CHRD domain
LPAEATFSGEEFRKGVLKMKTEKWNLKEKSLLLCLVLVFLLALISVVNVQAAASKTIYLDWHAVVPAGSGDPNMFGDGTVTVNAGQAQICYDLRVFVYPGDGSNWPPASTGIYQAATGSNGPLVVDLHPDFSTGPNASGCVGITSTLAHNIQKNPSGYYILVTSINHPEGAVRAQLVR